MWATARRSLLVFALLACALVDGGSRGLPPGEDAPGDDFPGRPVAAGGPHASAPDGDPADPDPPRPLTAVFGRLARPRVPAVASGHIVVRFEAALPLWQRRQIAAAGGGASFKLAHSGAFARVGVASGDTPQALAARLAPLPGVLSAEPDPVAWPLVGSVLKATPSDPLVPLQWWFERIRLPEALDSNSTGGEGVIVAVIDSGVAFGDGADFPLRRGLDLGATRFLPGLDLVSGGPPYDRGVGRDDPSSPRFGHGTFIAAQIAAAANNGTAGAGIAPRVTILPVRVIGNDNFAFFSDVADGVDFAVAQGARVVNLSLGGAQGSEVMRLAVERAHAAGVVIVAATGNEAADADAPDDVSFPAQYPRVIAVGASSFADGRTSYSNFGPGLDLMAPAGEDPRRFVDSQRRDAALAPSFLFDPVSGETTYSSFWATGTSFAAPQVAGAAALLMALDIRDPEAVRLLLLDSSRDLEAHGLDETTGHGLLDVARAHEGLGIAF